jgi:hypothetical protein
MTNTEEHVLGLISAFILFLSLQLFSAVPHLALLSYSAKIRDLQNKALDAILTLMKLFASSACSFDPD